MSKMAKRMSLNSISSELRNRYHLMAFYCISKINRGRSLVRFLVVCLFAVCVCLTGTANAQDTTVAPIKPLIGTEYLHIQIGELPIVLSAPHGGAMEPKGMQPRTGEGLETGATGFFTGRDSGTEELVLDVAEAIKKRFGKAPYVVASKLHRKFLDPNRPAHIAFDNPAVKPVYDLYHESLATFCREVANKYHTGVLVDLHGQGSRRDTVFRGTKNGLTVSRLKEKFGDQAHNGPQSLFGMLETRGWVVYPEMLRDPSVTIEPEQGGYTGGFTVQTYGSHRGLPIDAMQLEFGAEYRTKSQRPKTAVTLADALAEYSTRYLSLTVPERTPETTPEIVSMKRHAKEGAIRIALFVDSGVSSTDKLVDLLNSDSKLAFDKLDADDIRQGKLDDYSVLIHPGGSGSGQGKALGEEGREKVREFIKAGHGMVGICAGAYLASCDYDWSLHVLDAKVIDRAHWNRGYGNVTVALSKEGKEFLDLDKDRIDLYYHQGPLLAPAEDPQVPDFVSLASYEGEIAKNGAPQGVMPGTTAIAMSRYGRGRVVCYSPHPEKTPNFESLVLRGIHWAAESQSAPASEALAP